MPRLQINADLIYLYFYNYEGTVIIMKECQNNTLKPQSQLNMSNVNTTLQPYKECLIALHN